MSERRAIWECKIGTLDYVETPDGCDAPMRAAVRRAYFDITGRHADFVFSGWNAELDEIQTRIVKD